VTRARRREIMGAFAVSALLLLAAGTGCNDRAPNKLPKPPALVTEPVPVMPEGHPDLGALKAASRGPRRLSIGQLEASLDAIGNLPPGSIKLPADLAVTLGKPDYNRLSEESLEPSPLFMKFMVDLGTLFCTRVSDVETTRPAGERLMTRYASRDENLAFMLLRFTGIDGPAAAPYLARLTAAYERGARSPARPRGGHEAVCLALFTSPEFLLY
jgi:hypothetical protein